MKKYLIALLFLSQSIWASTPTLDQLSQSDADDVAKEFSTNFVHTNVSGASSLGKLFGFEAGFIAGATTTPKIESISKTYSSSSNISKIPTASLIGAVSFPLGITAELNYIPKINTSQVSINNYSVAGKFTFTNLLPESTFDLAIKGFFGSGDFSYGSTINNASTSNQNVDTKVTISTKSSGYNLIISKKLLFIEPYFGFGQVKTTTSIGTSASSTVNIFTFTSNASYSSKNSGTMLFGGLDLNLFILKLGFEYSKIMGVKKYVGKFSFYF